MWCDGVMVEWLSLNSERREGKEGQRKCSKTQGFCLNYFPSSTSVFVVSLFGVWDISQRITRIDILKPCNTTWHWNVMTWALHVLSLHVSIPMPSLEKNTHFSLHGVKAATAKGMCACLLVCEHILESFPAEFRPCRWLLSITQRRLCWVCIPSCCFLNCTSFPSKIKNFQDPLAQRRACVKH